MALDHVALHKSGMAGAELLRHAEAGARRVVAGLVDLDAEAGLLDMRDPVLCSSRSWGLSRPPCCAETAPTLAGQSRVRSAATPDKSQRRCCLMLSMLLLLVSAADLDLAFHAGFVMADLQAGEIPRRRCG